MNCAEVFYFSIIGRMLGNVKIVEILWRKMVKIIYVKRKIGNGIKRDNRNNFLGMNSEAAKAMRLKYPYGKNTVLIYDKMPKEQKKRTLLHEVAELEMMKDEKHNWGYERAHQAANAIESSPYLKVITTRGTSSRRGSIRRRI